MAGGHVGGQRMIFCGVRERIQHHMHPGPGQRLGDAQADARGGPRDDGGLACNAHVCLPMLRLQHHMGRCGKRHGLDGLRVKKRRHKAGVKS